MAIRLNTTQEERRLYAVYDTTKKISLENKFILDLRKFYDKLAKDFKLIYENTGEVISAFSYQEELEDLLKKHYKRIKDVFSTRLRKAMRKSSNNNLIIKQDTDSEIDAKLNDYINAHSIVQAQQISQTNDDNIKKAVAAAVVLAPVVNLQSQRDQIAEDAANSILADGYNRSPTIATTETQNMAENSKQTEYQFATSGLIALQLAKSLQRVWVTVLDNKTRYEHVLADGQIVGVGQPFLVGDENLMFPGDPNGSPENIINCRCASVPRIG